jgi:hypothetical protein
MTDTRNKKKILEEFGLRGASRFELVSALVLVLSGLESPDVIRDIYSRKGIRSLELVSAILVWLNAGKGEWLIAPPNRKRFAEPKFRLPESISGTTEYIGWVQLLRFAELFLASELAPEQPVSEDLHTIHTPTSVLSIVPQVLEPTSEEYSFGSLSLHEEVDLPVDSDQDFRPGDKLAVYDMEDGIISHDVRLSDGTPVGPSELSEALVGYNRMTSRTRTEVTPNLPCPANDARPLLRGRNVPIGYRAFHRLSALSRSPTARLLRITADLYGCPAIDWGNSSICIGRVKFRLIDYSTFVGKTTMW